MAGDVDAIRDHFVRGGDPGGTDRDGETLLHVAARHERLLIASVLLARGARVDARNTEGKRPADVVGVSPEAVVPRSSPRDPGERAELVGVLAHAEAVARAHGEAGPGAFGRPGGADELPELIREELHFTWDVHPDLPLFAVRHGERVLWTEMLAIDDSEPFELAGLLLRRRYGARARSLEPTPEAERRLWSGSLELWEGVQFTRRALREGAERVTDRGFLAGTTERRSGRTAPVRLSPAFRSPVTRVARLAGDPEPVKVALDPAGTTVAVQHAGGIDVLALEDGRTLATLGGELVGLPGGRRIARVSGGRVEVVEVAAAAAVASPAEDGYRSVLATALSPDGTLLTAAVSDVIDDGHGIVPALVHECCETGSGRRLWERTEIDALETRRPASLGFAGDGVIVGLHRDALTAWSVLNGSEVHVVPVAPAGPRPDARPVLEHPLVVPAGGLVLDTAVTGDGLEILDPRTLGRIRVMHLKDRRIRAVAVSPQGTHALSVSVDDEPEAQLWDLRRGTCEVLDLPEGHSVRHAAFDARNEWFLAATADGTLVRGELPR